MKGKNLNSRLVRLRFANGQTRSWVAGDELVIVLDAASPHEQRRRDVRQALRDAVPVQRGAGAMTALSLVYRAWQKPPGIRHDPGGFCIPGVGTGTARNACQA